MFCLIKRLFSSVKFKKIIKNIKYRILLLQTFNNYGLTNRVRIVSFYKQEIYDIYQYLISFINYMFIHAKMHHL